MESTQLIKQRIRSIEGTRQITRSMRLVATTKVQKARGRLKVNSSYLEEARYLAALSRHCVYGEKHPYITGKEVKRSLMIVISGDRGLCGGYNVSVIRHGVAKMAELKNPCRVITIGSKARDYFKRRSDHNLLESFTGMSESPFYPVVADIARLILDLYDKGEADEVWLCYTKFISMLLLEPKVVRILPIGEEPAKASAIRFEPKGAGILSSSVHFYLAAYIYGALLEAACCEQSARITSMDAAVKSADDLISGLTLVYNQARQSAITQELTEIVSGADAVAPETDVIEELAAAILEMEEEET